MAYYSVITNYPDHIATVEMPTMEFAITEYNYRKAILSEIGDTMTTVKILRVSAPHLLDVTPGRES